jgi:hypothetical protein
MADEKHDASEAMETDQPEKVPEPVDPAVAQRQQVLADYRRKLLEHRETEAKVKQCMSSLQRIDACTSRNCMCL